jgi:hypothetical protein
MQTDDNINVIIQPDDNIIISMLSHSQMIISILSFNEIISLKKKEKVINQPDDNI